MKSSTVVILVGLAQIVACSAEAPSSRPMGSTAAASSAAMVTGGHPADELARAQAFIDGRYPRSAVQHTFKTRLGDTIECIDFFAQPGVRALAAQGTPITQLPRPVRRVTGPFDPALAGVMFDGSVDEDGNARACSDTTVPMVRLTVGDIERRGGIDRLLSLHKTFEGGRAEAPDGAGPSYAHAQVGFTGGFAFRADRATLSVWTPGPIPSGVGNHSLMQTWTSNGGANWGANAPCAPNCQETVETGWTVDPDLNGDGNPHLFIYSTTDGYQTGCYNGFIFSGNGTPTNPLFPCQPWLTVPGAAFAPGQTLTASTGPSSVAELTVQVSQCNGDCPGGWAISVRQIGSAALGDIGYYPSSNFNGPFATQATVFQAGAEVDDITDLNTTTKTDTFTLPMGSGSSASAGYGVAAYVHDYGVYTGADPIGPFGTPGSTVKPPYFVAQFTPKSGQIETTWNNFFYLGSACNQSCANLGASCGTVSDWCGNKLVCPGCAAGAECLSDNQCCTPLTESQACQTYQCGTKPDGCGGTVTCPVTCGAGQYCDSSTNTCQNVPLCPGGCPSGYICEAPNGPPGVCVANYRCPPGYKYCNGKCIAQTSYCP